MINLNIVLFLTVLLIGGCCRYSENQTTVIGLGSASTYGITANHGGYVTGMEQASIYNGHLR